jgi:hypothetical protein
MSSRPRMMGLLIVGLVTNAIATTEAHRSSCRRWHADSSDHGTDPDGDLGDGSPCPDHTYCRGGKPESPAQSDTAAPASSERPHLC